MHTNIGISESNRQAVTNHLAKVLADKYVLDIKKNRNAHWHIKGFDFYEKNNFSEDQLDQLDLMIDNIAQHTQSLGHYTSASLKNYLKANQLSKII